MAVFRAISGMILVPGALLLAGCGGHRDKNADTETASINFSGTGDVANGGEAQTLAVSVPGFSAKLNLPGIDLNSNNTEIDGIKFHPGTKVTGMNVTGKAGDGTGGESKGTVAMAFTDPAAPPAALLAYYRDAARQAGWTEVPPAAGQQFAATKPNDKGSEQLAIDIGASGAGSTGHFLISGH